ncbi:MAG: hypothetical protein ACHQ53_03350 [Polyangiales bacterium]
MSVGRRPELTIVLALLAAGSSWSSGCAAARVPTARVDEAPRPSAVPLATAPQSPPTPQRGHTREVTPSELLAVRPLIEAAERVRGLRFAREVPVLVQDRDAIMGYVDGQIKADELERSRTIYTALGLLPPQLDVRKLLVRLMGEQIVGYYDVDTHRLVVRDDVMRAFGGIGTTPSVDLAEARVVLVHELVHALQDQHLGLSANIAKKRDSDADNAFRALVEGDATLAMIAFALERDSQPLAELTRNPARVRSLSDLVRGSPLAGSELGSAPPIVRVPLLSAYVDGLTFAANLHGDGGWGRVDRAHADPPASTEQVLHPERFAHPTAPERPRLPEARSALGPDYKLLYQDTLGELEMRVYFELGSPSLEAQRAVQGWRGDRLYAYVSATAETAIVWLATFIDERGAELAEHAAERASATSPKQARARQLVARSGRALLMLRNVPSDAHAALRARFERFAAAPTPGGGQGRAPSPEPD